MARKRARQQQPLRFRGAPVGLESFAPAERVAPTGATVRIPAVAELAPLALEASPVAGDAAYLRLSLPQSTPPGTYEGVLHAEEGDVPVVAEVEEYPSLQLAPSQLQLSAEVGGEAEAHLTALNDGNVPLEIGRTHAFGLFDVVGAERGIRAAFTDDVDQGRQRLDRLVDELAASHGGLARVRVTAGDGVLDPGDVRELRCVFRFSDDLEPGHTYSGTWPLHTLRYYVRVSVAAAREKTRRRRAG